MNKIVVGILALFISAPAITYVGNATNRFDMIN